MAYVTHISQIILCVLGPSGGLLLIDTFLAMVFAVVWGAGVRLLSLFISYSQMTYIAL